MGGGRELPVQIGEFGVLAVLPTSGTQTVVKNYRLVLSLSPVSFDPSIVSPFGLLEVRLLV